MSTTKKLKKIIEAEELCSTIPSLSENEHALKVNKAVKIYKELCLSALDPSSKMEVLVSFMRYIPEEGKEMLVRWRDMIPFTGGEENNRLIKLLTLVAKNSEVDPHERSITAVTLYNQTLYNVCYECFESIAMDEKVDVKYRVESCRYLYGSDMFHNKNIAQDCLLEIIEDAKTTSESRYKVIAGFISGNGVVSYLNKSKVRVAYDEDFVYGLQIVFFFNVGNGVRERILSGQHLLQMTCVDEKEREDINVELIKLARDVTLEENTRADAADVLLRLGIKSYREEAREIITSLGYAAVNTNSNNIMDRVKTIYNNSQNIHDEKISESVAKFIDKIMMDDTLKLRPFVDIQKDVSAAVRVHKKEQSKKFLAYKALDRISIDTATFTDKRVILAEIFVHVWTRIQTYSGDTKALLEERMIDELVDMGDTCSSGHSARFVNVLSIVDDDLKISFESQIIANVAGRVNARIRDIQDPDKKASIAMGMLPDSDEDDKAIYKEFITDVIRFLKTELYEEFVTAKYISKEEFDISFEKATKPWLDYILS